MFIHTTFTNFFLINQESFNIEDTKEKVWIEGSSYGIVMKW